MYRRSYLTWSSVILILILIGGREKRRVKTTNGMETKKIYHGNIFMRIKTKIGGGGGGGGGGFVFVFLLFVAPAGSTAVGPSKVSVCASQPTIPAVYSAANRHYMLRTLATLVNPVCAKRFHRHFIGTHSYLVYSGQPALLNRRCRGTNTLCVRCFHPCRGRSAVLSPD